jgi:hypothetical protein
MLKILKISILSLFLTVFLTPTAFSWPWDKKEEAPAKATKPAEEITRTETPAVAPAKAEDKRGEEDSEEPVPFELRRPVPPPLPMLKPIKPSQTQLSSDVSAVQDELRQVIKFNRSREQELHHQMDALRETLEKARLYNQILTQIKPPVPQSNIATQAVDQEKIRLIHEQVKKMTPVHPAAAQVQAIPQVPTSALKAREAGVLPIRENAPKAPESAPKTTEQK